MAVGPCRETGRAFLPRPDSQAGDDEIVLTAMDDDTGQVGVMTSLRVPFPAAIDSVLGVGPSISLILYVGKLGVFVVSRPTSPGLPTADSLASRSTDIRHRPIG